MLNHIVLLQYVVCLYSLCFSHACSTIPMGQVYNRLWVLCESHYVYTTCFY